MCLSFWFASGCICDLTLCIHVCIELVFYVVSVQVIVGRMWIDVAGEVLLRNHATGSTCTVRYAPYSYLSSDFQRKVTALVEDAAGNARYSLCGHWDERIEGQPVLPALPAPSFLQTHDNSAARTGPSRILWQRNPIRFFPLQSLYF